MPDPDADSELLRIAEAIADGRPVDWNAVAGTSVSPTHRAALRALSQLAAAAGIETTESVDPPTWGPFRLLERLGAGAWGEVWRAFDSTLQKEIAVKVARRDSPAAERPDDFIREARRLARVRHPNVLNVYGADVHDGHPGLWCELIRGRTLEEWLQQQGRLGPDEAGRVGMTLCQALSAVHASGLVHRDVKTSNVMREEGGRIVLMDFGAGAERAPVEGLLGDPANVGTPVYMAPERMLGQPASRASDVYALGVVLYRLLSGAYPVQGAANSDDTALVRVALRDRRPDLPTALVQIVERALEVDPKARYATPAELERDLAKIGGMSGGDRPRLHPPRFRRVRAYVWIAVAVIAGGVLFRVLKQPDKPVDGVLHAVSTPSEAALPLTGTATLLAVDGDGSHPLTMDAAVRTGDHLALRFESPESCYVYVFDEDEKGEAYVLFPIPGLDLGNPLRGRDAHELPGRLANQAMSWRVTSAGGQERLYLVASRKPLPGLEAKLAAFPRAQPGRPLRYPRADTSAILSLRGIGAVDVTPVPSREARLADLFPDLASPKNASPDVWLWQTRLKSR